MQVFAPLWRHHFVHVLISDFHSGVCTNACACLAAYVQRVINQHHLQTFILFLEQPDIEDMLLNCVALAFLPSVDQAMVVIIQSLRPGMYPPTNTKICTVSKTDCLIPCVIETP